MKKLTLYVLLLLNSSNLFSSEIAHGQQQAWFQAAIDGAT